MDATLHRREFLAACAVGMTGALAGCADPDVAMFVDAVPTDRAIAEQATLQPDRYGQYRSLVADAVDGGTDRPGGNPDRTRHLRDGPRRRPRGRRHLRRVARTRPGPARTGQAGRRTGRRRRDPPTAVADGPAPLRGRRANPVGAGSRAPLRRGRGRGPACDHRRQRGDRDAPRVPLHRARTGREGAWLVEYGSRDYWVTVDFVRMPEYADRLADVEEF